MGNPHGFKKGIELIPANAKNMKELKSVNVKWDCGDKIYEKNSLEFKCFEESSGCFDFKEKFDKNGPNDYDHPSLKKLIKLEDFNKAAPMDHEVNQILDHRRLPRKGNEFLVKFKGYRLQLWLTEKACKESKNLINEYFEKKNKKK